MSLKVVVFVAVLIAGVWAADSDTEAEGEAITADFSSAEGMTRAKEVSSVAVAIDPVHTVKATIVKHLPSHSSAHANEEESEHDTLGNAFETSNFEADQVYDSDAESLESTADDAAADARFATATATAPAPALVKAASTTEDIPDMTTAPLGTPTNANVDPTKPAAKPLAAEKKPEPIMDKAAQTASHLYIGYEDPIALPDGTEIKRKVDTSGTIGTEAGTAFNYKKGETPKTAKCANGCQLRLPVMVGFRGIREQPAEGTRRVTVPGDRERHRAVHNAVETTDRISWAQGDLDTARSHLKKSSSKLFKLRLKRKAYEDTALNREVVVPTHDAPY